MTRCCSDSRIARERLRGGRAPARGVAQEATVTASLGSDLRGTLRAGWRHATDRAGDGSSYWGGANLIAALGHGAVLRAGLGARRVQPDVVAARTPFTAEVGLGLRPARYAAVSVGYSRTPFDETAGLMRQDLTVDAVDLSFDISPGPGWSLSGGGGGAWFSDQNNRYSAVVALLGRVMKGLQIGPFARVMGYRQPRPGLYFTPEVSPAQAGPLLHTGPLQCDRRSRSVPMAAERLGSADGWRRWVTASTSVWHAPSSAPNRMARRRLPLARLGREQRDRTRRIDHE